MPPECTIISRRTAGTSPHASADCMHLVCLMRDKADADASPAADAGPTATAAEHRLGCRMQAQPHALLRQELPSLAWRISVSGDFVEMSRTATSTPDKPQYNKAALRCA